MATTRSAIPSGRTQYGLGRGWRTGRLPKYGGSSLPPTSLAERAGSVAAIAEQFGSAHGRFRARRREIERDADFTVKERERALRDLTESFEKEVAGIWKQAEERAGQVGREIAQVERGYAAPDPTNVDRAWARLRPLFEAGITLDDVLDDHVKDRADVAALRREYPAYRASKAGPKATDEGIRQLVRMALNMVDLHEDGIVAPELRDARQANRRLKAAAEAINETANLVLKERTRPVTGQELISAGLASIVGQAEASVGVVDEEIEASVREGASPLDMVKAGLGDGAQERP